MQCVSSCFHAGNERSDTNFLDKSLPPFYFDSSGIKLNSYMKPYNLQRFEDEKHRLLWISAGYEYKNRQLEIFKLTCYFI